MSLTSALNPLHVTVSFGNDIPASAQGPALMNFEKQLRASTGLDVRVYKDRMQDDSKLRVMMTPAERERL